MTTREKLIQKVQSLPEESLSKVDEFIESIENTNEKPSLMQQLRSIPKIKGPKDFSSNIDLYMSGEKKIEDNLD